MTSENTNFVKPLTRDIFRSLVASGAPHSKTILFFLDCAGSSVSKIAKNLKISPGMVSRTISGSRTGAAVRSAVAEVLGFNPWGIK